MESLIRDISQYFEQLKNCGQEKFNISSSSKIILDELLLSSEGNEYSDIYIIDGKSNFFSGKTGALLKKILKAMKLDRNAVCICDIDSPESLLNRIKRVKPKIVITLGNKATCAILNNNTPLQYLRGRIHDTSGLKVMPTWHPSYLLENSDKKRDVWEDMKIVMKFLES